MPGPTWKHYCRADGEDVCTGEKTCSQCGVTGKFEGWSFSVVERMGLYQRRTGFKPLGPHRGLVDLLLSPLLKACERCGGRGLLAHDEKSYLLCPECDGRMYVPNVSDAEFQACGRRIAAEYPNETAPMGRVL